MLARKCGVEDIDYEKRNEFVSGPVEVVKVGEPLANSVAITEDMPTVAVYRDGFAYWRRRFEPKTKPTGEKRPTGKWITTRTLNHDGNPYCTNCDEETIIRYKYCPNCGAKMKGDEE